MFLRLSRQDNFGEELERLDEESHSSEDKQWSPWAALLMLSAIAAFHAGPGPLLYCTAQQQGGNYRPEQQLATPTHRPAIPAGLMMKHLLLLQPLFPASILAILQVKCPTSCLRWLPGQL